MVNVFVERGKKRGRQKGGKYRGGSEEERRKSGGSGEAKDRENWKRGKEKENTEGKIGEKKRNDRICECGREVKEEAIRNERQRREERSRGVRVGRMYQWR